MFHSQLSCGQLNRGIEVEDRFTEMAERASNAPLYKAKALIFNKNKTRTYLIV